MNCDVIKDLLPLYIDECCTEESARLVAEHLKGCAQCQSTHAQMNHAARVALPTQKKAVLHRISDWKASVMQSLLLFVSFAIITVGVALEAGTPTGLMNGFWAFSLVIPATGFLLSLANWYFVRLYKSRRSFSNFSLLATIGFTACASIWAMFHYDIDLAQLFAENGLAGFMEVLRAVLLLDSIGIGLTAVFCVLSKVLSNQYAKLLGRE